ncbi:MAG: hypothetical protein JRD89_00280 [Deltaproteobacteria bacterium]|nr:hypothetical protein [Deltaproteobacteria bacterium]
MADKERALVLMEHCDDAGGTQALLTGVDYFLRGRWSEQELQRALQQADIFVYADDVDEPDQSAAAADVLGFGRPVVVSGCRKHADVLPWCVQAKGAQEIAERVLWLLSNAAAYQRAGLRALQGASFRRQRVLARQYRAAVVHVLARRYLRDYRGAGGNTGPKRAVEHERDG